MSEADLMKPDEVKLLVAMLRDRSRELAPDYPGVNSDLEPWEHLWAITSSLEGTRAANGDCHALIRFLAGRLGVTPAAAWELYKKDTADRMRSA